MSKGTLLDFVAEKNKATYFHREDGKTYVETRQDCAPMVAAARMLAEVPPAREDGWRFMCVIPDTVMDQAINEGWLHDKARWRRWMNDSDNKAFNGGRSNVS